MSTAHWNGTIFRVGEEGVSARVWPGPGYSIEELKLEDIHVANLTQEFSGSVLEVEAICKPRMLLRENTIRDAKIAQMQRSQT